MLNSEEGEEGARAQQSVLAHSLCGTSFSFDVRKESSIHPPAQSSMVAALLPVLVLALLGLCADHADGFRTLTPLQGPLFKLGPWPSQLMPLRATSGAGGGGLKLDYDEDFYSVLEMQPSVSTKDLKKGYYNMVLKVSSGT
jgi:hypothetical protein